jgi:hypothetical protein
MEASAEAIAGVAESGRHGSPKGVPSPTMTAGYKHIEIVAAT